MAEKKKPVKKTPNAAQKVVLKNKGLLGNAARALKKSQDKRLGHVNDFL